MEIVKTDYARRVDQAGRVVIPVKLRNEAGIGIGDLVEFHVFVDDNGKPWVCFPFGEHESAIQKALAQSQD